MRKQRLFYISELVLLCIIVGIALCVWRVEGSALEASLCGVPFVVVTAINFGWTWNRKWSEFHW